MSHRPFRGRRCSIGNSRHRSRDLPLSVPHIGASPVPQPRGTIQSEVLSTLRTEKGPPGSWDPGGPSCQCCGNMAARARADRCRAARSVALPSWQLTADGVIRSALRFGHSFDGSRMVLPRSDRGGNSPSGIFAGILERERAIGAAYRAAEGLRPAIKVAQLAKKQPRAACGWRVGLAKNQPRVACGWWGRSPEEN